LILINYAWLAVWLYAAWQEATPEQHGGPMGVRNERDATAEAATEAKLAQTAGKRRNEHAIELDAIEDDEVRQILKIPPRRKLPKPD
jgi:hypothetical protein